MLYKEFAFCCDGRYTADNGFFASGPTERDINFICGGSPRVRSSPVNGCIRIRSRLPGEQTLNSFKQKIEVLDHQMQVRWKMLKVLTACTFILGVRMWTRIPAADGSVNGELASVIALGESIVQHTVTHPLTKKYVGNALNCTSCHLNNGRHATAGTLIGTATAYPAWSPRENRVITLEDRVLNCFMRSCNGVRPPLGSDVSVAVTAYITSLSQGQSMKMNPDRPIGPGALKPLAVKSEQADVSRGSALYAVRCAECHQADGKGTKENPPVWGELSFNDGAGLSSVDNLGAWLKVAMPLNETDLSDQQAIDIAAYVNSQNRPHFDLSQHLPAKEMLGEYNASTK